MSSSLQCCDDDESCVYQNCLNAGASTSIRDESVCHRQPTSQSYLNLNHDRPSHSQLDKRYSTTRQQSVDIDESYKNKTDVAGYRKFSLPRNNFTPIAPLKSKQILRSTLSAPIDCCISNRPKNFLPRSFCKPRSDYQTQVNCQDSCGKAFNNFQQLCSFDGEIQNYQRRRFSSCPTREFDLVRDCQLPSKRLSVSHRTLNEYSSSMSNQLYCVHHSNPCLRHNVECCSQNGYVSQLNSFRGPKLYDSSSLSNDNLPRQYSYNCRPKTFTKYYCDDGDVENYSTNRISTRISDPYIEKEGDYQYSNKESKDLSYGNYKKDIKSCGDIHANSYLTSTVQFDSGKIPISRYESDTSNNSLNDRPYLSNENHIAIKSLEFDDPAKNFDSKKNIVLSTTLSYGRNKDSSVGNSSSRPLRNSSKVRNVATWSLHEQSSVENLDSPAYAQKGVFCKTESTISDVSFNSRKGEHLENKMRIFSKFLKNLSHFSKSDSRSKITAEVDSPMSSSCDIINMLHVVKENTDSAFQKQHSRNAFSNKEKGIDCLIQAEKCDPNHVGLSDSNSDRQIFTKQPPISLSQDFNFLPTSEAVNDNVVASVQSGKHQECCGARAIYQNKIYLESRAKASEQKPTFAPVAYKSSILLQVDAESNKTTNSNSTYRRRWFREERLRKSPSRALSDLKEKSCKKISDDSPLWQQEVLRSKTKNDKVWQTQLDHLEERLSNKEGELQLAHLEKEQLQRQLHDCTCRDSYVQNGRTDSAFEDDDEYHVKPLSYTRGLAEERISLAERLRESEERADHLSHTLDCKLIELSKLQIALSQQTREMIELEKSYLQLQCRLRTTKKSRLCSRSLPFSKLMALSNSNANTSDTIPVTHCADSVTKELDEGQHNLM